MVWSIFSRCATSNSPVGWLERAHRRRVQKFAEEKIQSRIIKVSHRGRRALYPPLTRFVQRILANALTRWTNRTIDVKNRELQATMDRDTWLIKIAFRKWKSAQNHHAFVVSLMESYQLVKREGMYLPPSCICRR
jgi:protein SFI1